MSESLLRNRSVNQDPFLYLYPGLPLSSEFDRVTLKLKSDDEDFPYHDGFDEEGYFDEDNLTDKDMDDEDYDNFDDDIDDEDLDEDENSDDSVVNED